MFRLNELAIYSNGVEQKKIAFGSITYIYGDNKRGKTLILRLIDFVLSSSDNFLVNNPQGLEGIDAASLDVQTDNGKIVFLRNIANSFFYKLDGGDFLQVQKENYDNMISSFLCKPANETLENYKKIFGERLSFRALTFINFLEENGIGNLARVFTATSQIKHFYRAPEIFQFAFEQEKVKRLIDLEKQLETKEKELKTVSRKSIELDFYTTSLQSLFRKYSISYSNEMSQNLVRIKEFSNTFSSPSKSSDDDLNYLLFQSNELSNQIRAQKELENQSNKIVGRMEKFGVLAEDIKNIFEGSQYASDYLAEIDKILKEDDYSKTILSLKDYNETIKSLKKAKKEFDERIQTIRNNLSDKTVEEKRLDVSVMIDLCKRIESQPKINDSKVIESEMASIKERIKSTKKEIRSAFETLNSSITTKYINTNNSVLIDEEKSKSHFKIVFDYKTISSYGEYRDSDNRTKTFLPGSSAKMAYWQLCIYLETIKYFKNNLPQMPLLNLLVADGVNQPFDDIGDKENYLTALNSIIQSCEEFGLQAIIISTDKTDEIERKMNEVGVFYDIGTGLNPLHK